MFRNYLLVAFRNLYKNRVFALINILGLGMALSICIVAYFNHMFGYDFDRNNENFSEIYRVNSYREMQDRDQEYGSVPSPLGLEIKKDIPAVSKSFLVNLAISSVIGCVGGYYLSLMLLDSIWDNFLNFTPSIYIYSVGIIFAATIGTIVGKVYQAALQNPVTCLRYE